MMELVQIENDNFYDAIHNNEKLLHRETFENNHYMYQNKSCLTSNNKWFKGSRDRGLKLDIAA